MRALAYLHAVRIWGDVPLFTEAQRYSPDIYHRTHRQSTSCAK